MKSPLTLMPLAASMLSAISQAQAVSICDRTPQVRDAIMQRLGWADCAAVDSEALAGLENLGIDQLPILQAGDFNGLTSLQQLTALPDGVFDSLTGLQDLDLSNNHLVGLTEITHCLPGFLAGVF